ncbi:MAG: ABC transporter ATP-binding protein [Eubacteriales bacterium]|nr:ABC transporter ATP-binding protein [Eubacteriales bacterium]
MLDSKSISCFEFKNVSKSFADKIVLDDVSLTIPKGSSLCFVGGNGSGKTTALKLCANLLLPDSGEVYFDGEVVKVDDIRLQSKIGAFFNPERSLYWRLSGWENVLRTIELKKANRSKEIEAANDLFRLLELEEAKHKQVGTYSKGMKAKILFINAMISDPEVIILDEPFEGLDVQTRRTVINMLSTLQKKGKTILLTAHNLLEMQNFSSHVCWFDEGRIRYIGSPEELIKSIPGQGVVEVYTQKAEIYIGIMRKDKLDYIDLVQDEDILRILTDDLTGTFNYFEKIIDATYERLELHAKGLEDVYVFYKGEKDK